MFLCTQKSVSVKTHNIVFLRGRTAHFFFLYILKEGNQNELQTVNE